MKNHYDVCILGGGLAGLTLSLQLKKANPEISILTLEMRKDDAPDSAHKVGESTVELGTHYIREVLDLKDYMDEHQLPKHGLRFFFTPQHKDDISKRVELGPRESLPIPSHQIDRGTFENELVVRSKQLGANVLLGAKVTSVDLNDGKHSVTYTHNDKKQEITSNWVVDATGRSSFLKRKLGLKKELDHQINAAWFRVKGEIDIDEWSDNETWSSYLKPGLRRLGTVHFLDKGYWVWLIPLATGNTSVGIVADPETHPFDTFNQLDKAMDWLQINEPLCHQYLSEKKEDVIDFRVLKHFAHHSEKLFSTDKWAITGDSGLFLDPFYSPGTDFIAISNTFIADLIVRDLTEENILIRTSVYEKTFLALFDNWVPVYKDKYPLWGLTQTMVVKIFWDWATYWSVPTLLFTNNGLTNVIVLRDLFSKKEGAGQKFGLLNAQMQQVFIDWSKHDTETFSDSYIDPFDLNFLKEFHKGIDKVLRSRDLIKKVQDNVEILEHLASEIFRVMSKKIYGTSMDLKVNPYKMSLKEKPEDGEGGNDIDDDIRKDVARMWYYN
ncbi:MAG: flavin-dependent dehydrogenase [Parvicellaceae bacterium]|jgi:flavin-dependent dehydrogenase